MMPPGPSRSRRGPSWAVLVAVGFLVSVLLGALLYATAPIEVRYAPAAGDPPTSVTEDPTRGGPDDDG